MDIYDWCIKHKVDPSHAIALRGVLKANYSHDRIPNAFKEIDRSQVVEVIDETDITFQLLLSFSKPVVDLNIPTTIDHTDNETWTIIKWDGKTPEKDTHILPTDFQGQLQKFLLEHGKTLNDLRLDSIPSDTKEVVVKHLIGNNVPRTAGVRRLRQFSGRVPIPSNEVDFETWSQLVQQLLRDDSLSQAEQKSILSQSLFPPALNILNKVTDKSTARECHDVLNEVYGLAVDADDLYTLFRETYQSEGELPSKFLMRLDENLTRATKAGAVGVAKADHMRLAQFVRGLVYDEMLSSTLNLKQRKSNPPTYLTLIKEVRSEEINSRARAEKRTPKAVSAKAALCSYEALSHEVEVLRTELHHLKSTPSPPESTPNPKTRSSPAPNTRPKICYNCGEDGHHMRGCPNPTNATLVQQKLVKRFNQAGNGRGHPGRRDNGLPHQ
ncbi:paraneoplastic antigen Ma2 homolog [Antedon mediterranea]|uniref:paraneoplastic antigen Ma2 homolog n=1 Tax=Antedon mediterranea TaxID=105859 RepID=UPI003AF89780